MILLWAFNSCELVSSIADVRYRRRRRQVSSGEGYEIGQQVKASWHVEEVCRTEGTTHVNQNEGLIFEKSSPGKKAYRLAELDVPAVDAASLLGDRCATDLGVMPELSEIEIIRHFTRLSTWNYAIDLGMYPLGSCTMKYNPRVNELVARLEGIAEAHPYQPESLSQGCLGIMKMLQDA